MIRQPDHGLIAAENAAAIGGALAKLRPREQKIIAMRFGLDDGECKTLKQCAAEFGVTPPRIRQIEMNALRRMRFQLRDARSLLADMVQE